MVYVLILINLASFGIVFLLLSRSAWKRAYFGLPRIVQKLLVVFNVGPLLLMPLAVQPRLSGLAVQVALPLGVAILLAALILWALAFREIGFIPSMKRAEGVLSSSVYGLVRHPIYLGNVLSALGLALVFSGQTALLYVPVPAILYGFLIRLEEQDLLALYGEAYRRYQAQVSYRMIPYLF